MISFLTNKQALEKIEGLESRVAELEAELATANELVVALQTEQTNHEAAVAVLANERDELAGKLEAAQATIASQEETITAANTKLATFDDEIEARVQNQIASIGFQGTMPQSVVQPVGESNEKTREEFNAMTPHDRMQFVKAGGKIK